MTYYSYRNMTGSSDSPVIIRKKLVEARGKYSLNDISGDVDNPAVEIYSPTLEALFNIQSLGSAMETANVKALTDKLVSQGLRKTGINRSPYSIAVNIFAAALGTEVTDPAVQLDNGSLSRGDMRLRNTAYAVIDPKTGEKVNVEWDFVDPMSLSPENQDKYFSVNRNYRDDNLIPKRKAAAAKNRKLAVAEYIDDLSEDLRLRLTITQDPEMVKAFLSLVKRWDYFKGEQTKGLTLVLDKLPEPYNKAVFHLEGRNNSLLEKNFTDWLSDRMRMTAGNSADREKVQKAKEYFNAITDLWDAKVFTRLCSPAARKTISWKQFLNSPLGKKISI